MTTAVKTDHAIFALGCFWGIEYYFVFPDGPSPSGLRYCTNSESMQVGKETMDNG